MDPFIAKWLLSLLVGIVWVAVATTIAERVSGKLGGLIVGLPSTAVVSLLFIGLTQGVPAAMTAAVIMPYSSGLYCTFFLTYLWLTKKSFSVGLIFSLIIWLLFASLAAAFPVRDIYLSAFVWLVLVTLSIVYAVKKLPINHQLIPAKIVKTPL